MKATGIVRKIDELGRIVIPKEIRRTLRIKVGDPLEIFTNREGELILKKYSSLNDLSGLSESSSKALAEQTGFTTVIVDRDSVVAIAGPIKGEYIDKSISARLDAVLEKGEIVHLRSDIDEEMLPIKIDDGLDEYVTQIVMPIKVEDESIGAVVLLSKNPGDEFGDRELLLCDITAKILAKYAV